MRTVIKDIAHRCNVSTATVSAALRDKKGTIFYSKETQALVCRVSEEMKYRPNRLARAMRTGIVPLVALFVHDERSYQDEINLYLHDLVPNVSRSLQEKRFEMIFVPYGDAEELKKRIRHLVEDSLTNGIITNFPPEHGNEIADFLKKTGMPFVMLGQIQDESVPCVYVDNAALYEKITEYAVSHGFKRTIQVLARKSIKGGIDWKLTPVMFTPPLGKCGIEDWKLNDSGTLWAASGESTRRALIQEKGVAEKNVISIENKRLMIQFRPSIYVRSKEQLRASTATELLMEWIKNDKVPAQRRIEILPEDIEFIL